ncbi:MAG: M23 family metallopeptidase [Pseudomonadota bacterium]
MDKYLPILFIAYSLLLSGISFYWQLAFDHHTRAGRTIQTLAAASIMAFAFLATPWAFTSYYLRYIVLGLFVAFVGYSWRKMKQRVSVPGRHGFRSSIPSTLLLLLFAGLDALAVASHYHRGDTLRVSFPLGSGTYYILQGGDSVVTNPFHTLAGNAYAIDVVKLNTFGNRARGISPRALHAYEIYGDKLHSPCAGRVLEVRDGLSDNPPGEPDKMRTEGNYIVLFCSDVEVFMGHLKQNSIGVVKGQTVAQGLPIAEVGNSGNSLEPHLHIEAKRDGEGVGLAIHGRALSTNSLVRSRYNLSDHE